MTKKNAFQQEDIAEVWDRVSDTYDYDRYWDDPAMQAWYRTLLKHIGNPEGQSALEVGCGSAFQSLALAEQGARVSLLDLSARAMEKARAAFVRRGQEAPPCHVCNALNSGLPDNSFDVVWNNGVIEHFSDEGKEQLLREMFRMTKPQGKTIIMVPNRLCWPFQIGQAYSKLRGTWIYGEEDDMSPGRLRRLCRKASIREFEAYAFDPVLGWYWLPFFGSRLKKLIGPKPVEAHMRKSIFGWMSVLVISKTGDNLKAAQAGAQRKGAPHLF